MSEITYKRGRQFGHEVTPETRARISEKKRQPVEGRFLSRIDKNGPNGCWLWTGTIMNRDGYGVMWANGRAIGAHRISFEIFKGAIPSGLQIDHLCINPRCVNPAHLRAVSARENTLALHSHTSAKKNLVKTECKFGHPFDSKNTYVGMRRNRPYRACRACKIRRERSASTQSVSANGS